MARPRSASGIPTDLLGHFRRQLPRYGVGMVLLGAYQYGQYWFDTRLQVAVDGALGGQREVAIRLGVAMIGVALGAFVIRVLSRMAIFNGGRIVEYELRKAVLERLQRLGPAFYGVMSTGEIMSRATNDLSQLRMLLGFGVLNALNTVFALASALAVMLALSPKLTVASLATLPLLLLVSRFLGKRMYAYTRANQDALGRLSEIVQSTIAGVRVVRSFSLEPAEMRRFEAQNIDYLDKSLALAWLRGSFGPIVFTVTALGVVVVFWYGGHLVLVGALTPGDFLSFYRALTRLTWPLVSLGFLVALVQRGRAAFSRVQEILDAKPEVADGSAPAPSEVLGRLEVKDLRFSHGAHEVLRGVTFSLEPGESVAVVGRTGSGKSTIAALLARLLPTPKASVFLDGTDVCDLPVEHVRRAIGYAQQTAFLFSTTVGRNVGYALAEPDGPDAERIIRDAAREARVLDEVMDLDGGFDTVVGERGVQLSGGQKQRVALARALVSKPKILVLDDPLSAVDADTERGILDALDRQRAQRSLVLITHRVAAAQRCDRVVVVDEGRVVDVGTHAELIRKTGLYADFAEEQRIQSELERLGEETFAAVGT